MAHPLVPLLPLKNVLSPTNQNSVSVSKDATGEEDDFDATFDKILSQEETAKKPVANVVLPARSLGERKKVEMNLLDDSDEEDYRPPNRNVGAKPIVTFGKKTNEVKPEVNQKVEPKVEQINKVETKLENKKVETKTNVSTNKNAITEDVLNALLDSPKAKEKLPQKGSNDVKVDKFPEEVPTQSEKKNDEPKLSTKELYALQKQQRKAKAENDKPIEVPPVVNDKIELNKLKEEESGDFGDVPLPDTSQAAPSATSRDVKYVDRTEDEKRSIWSRWLTGNNKEDSSYIDFNLLEFMSYLERGVMSSLNYQQWKYDKSSDSWKQGSASTKVHPFASFLNTKISERCQFIRLGRPQDYSSGPDDEDVGLKTPKEVPIQKNSSFTDSKFSQVNKSIQAPVGAPVKSVTASNVPNTEKTDEKTKTSDFKQSDKADGVSTNVESNLANKTDKPTALSAPIPVFESKLAPVSLPVNNSGNDIIIGNLNATISSLSLQVSQLKSDLASSEANVASGRKRIENLMNSQSKLQEQLQECESELRSEKLDKQRVIRDGDAALMQLSSQMQSKDRCISDLSSEISELKHHHELKLKSFRLEMEQEKARAVDSKESFLRDEASHMVALLKTDLEDCKRRHAAEVETLKRLSDEALTNLRKQQTDSIYLSTLAKSVNDSANSLQMLSSNVARDKASGEKDREISLESKEMFLKQWEDKLSRLQEDIQIRESKVDRTLKQYEAEKINLEGEMKRMRAQQADTIAESAAWRDTLSLDRSKIQSEWAEINTAKHQWEVLRSSQLRDLERAKFEISRKLEEVTVRENESERLRLDNQRRIDEERALFSIESNEFDSLRQDLDRQRTTIISQQQVIARDSKAMEQKMAELAQVAELVSEKSASLVEQTKIIASQQHQLEIDRNNLNELHAQLRRHEEDVENRSKLLHREKLDLQRERVETLQIRQSLGAFKTELNTQIGSLELRSQKKESYREIPSAEVAISNDSNFLKSVLADITVQTIKPKKQDSLNSSINFVNPPEVQRNLKATPQESKNLTSSTIAFVNKPNSTVLSLLDADRAIEQRRAASKQRWAQQDLLSAAHAMSASRTASLDDGLILEETTKIDNNSNSIMSISHLG